MKATSFLEEVKQNENFEITPSGKVSLLYINIISKDKMCSDLPRNGAEIRYFLVLSKGTNPIKI